MMPKMRFQGPERGNEDARRRLLAHPPAAPPLLERPFLQRPFPTQHMPKARPRRRRNPADRLDRPPHRVPRRLDPEPGRLALAPRAAVAHPEPRQIDRPDRVELRPREPGPEIL